GLVAAAVAIVITRRPRRERDDRVTQAA
ncbi:MAG: hypothetical protein QOG77_458, partial [Solirubrobacteraceae bacterium]|nr:hypothetical protein [Solirubrobacteraceae bacterium]